MITISNVSEQYASVGPQEYEIRVVADGKRDSIKGRFTHNAEDGLAECLRKAAEAVEIHEAQFKEHLMQLTVDDFLAPGGLLERFGATTKEKTET